MKAVLFPAAPRPFSVNIISLLSLNKCLGMWDSLKVTSVATVILMLVGGWMDDSLLFMRQQ